MRQFLITKKFRKELLETFSTAYELSMNSGDLNSAAYYETLILKLDHLRPVNLSQKSEIGLDDLLNSVGLKLPK